MNDNTDSPQDTEQRMLPFDDEAESMIESSRSLHSGSESRTVPSAVYYEDATKPPHEPKRSVSQHTQKNFWQLED